MNTGKTIKRIRQIKKTLAFIILIACLMNMFTITSFAAGSKELVLTIKQNFTVVQGEPPSEEFDYILVSKDASHPMPQGSKGDVYNFTIEGTDDIEIDKIIFSEPGIYEYEIKHQTISLPEYIDDVEIYSLKVTVNYDLSFIVLIQKADGKKAEIIVFEHTYDDLSSLGSDPDLMVDPPIMKTVSGNPAADSVFTFKLTAENPSNPMPKGSSGGVKTVTITGSGKAEFGKWSYDNAGIYRYKVHEVNSGIRGYIYDTEVYTITDTVTEEGGELILSRLVTNKLNRPVSSLAFFNTYRADGFTAGFGPKTGDDTNGTLYIVLFCLAGITALGSIVYLSAGGRRRRERSDS